MKIKELPRVERPREKVEQYGPERLSNVELLAILLRTGTKDVNVVELAKRILNKFGGEQFAHATFKELKSTYGIGAAKASEILAAFELSKRMLQGKQQHIYLTPKDIFVALKDIRDNKKEHFVIFFLDTRNQEIKREIISVGTINASLVHPREVFEPAIRYSAAHIIIAHNHPSNVPEPSDEDEKITKRLVVAGNILGIEILDHIVVSKSAYFSFKENKLL